VDIGDDVDDHRTVGLEALCNGRPELARVLDPDAERAHVLGDAGEIDLAEGPHFPRLLGLRAAVDTVEAALGLIAAGVVVDHGDRVDAPARRRLDLGDMVPEPGIAGESHYRPLRAGAFGAEPGRKRPAEMAGAAHVVLLRAGEIEHSAH